MVCKVVNLRKEKYDVYIGRGSKWGNKFVIGKDGDREEVIRKYRDWIRKNDYLLSCLGELKDKVLGCYCKPLACHGDVLVELVNFKMSFRDIDRTSLSAVAEERLFMETITDKKDCWIFN